jgi:integrase
MTIPSDPQDQQSDKKDRRAKEKKRKQKRRGHGEGTVFQRKDGRWVAELTLEDGRRKPFYATTQAGAIAKLKQAQYEMKQGILATGPNQKFETYLRQWFEEIHALKFRASTYKTYRGMIDNHILPALGHFPIQKITAQKIQSLYSEKSKAGFSPSLVRSLHKILRPAFDNAVKWRLIAYNPCNSLSLPSERSRKVESLTIEQAQYLLKSVRGKPLEAFVVLALTTGMRHGELLALRWEDINFAVDTTRGAGEEGLGSVYIHRTVSHQGSLKFVEGAPKTESSERIILIPLHVCNILNAHRAKQNELRLKAGEQWEERDLVFCNRHGGFLRQHVVAERFHKLLDEVGLPRMRVHDLRHSAASIMLAMGVNPKLIQQILGHSHLSMTMMKYTHILSSMQKEAAEKIKDLFKRPSED